MAKSGEGNAEADDDQVDLKAEKYLTQFDLLLISLLLAGLLSSLLYGLASGARLPADFCGIVSPSAGEMAAADRPLCAGVSHFGGGLLAVTFSLAAAMLGAFLGFLFGLPRTLTGAAPSRTPSQNTATGSASSTSTGTVVTATSGDDHDGDQGRGLGAGVNTNLEQISNWLTTVIVGVGLTKIETIPHSLELFGDKVTAYFSFGGQIFGIGGGLFFLFVGFFLAYVGTRVKLTRVFLKSQLDNRKAIDGVLGLAVGVATKAEPVTLFKQEADSAPGTPGDPALDAADAVLLGKSLADLKTDDEILAWANANARHNNFKEAITGYRDVLKRVPLTEDLARRFAMILARAGDEPEAWRILDAARATSGSNAPDQSEARKQVADVSLQTRLRQGLYKAITRRGWQDSIVAGEELIKDPEQAKVGINHLWLACAYAQKLRAIEEGVHVASANESAEARQRAIEEIRTAVTIDPALKTLIGDLYYPERQKGDDDDLQVLNPEPQIADLIA